MEPLVSFILVNWNTRELTLQCIKSILDDCAGLSIEIIVSDNASTDGSADAIEKMYPMVTIIRNTENLGFAKGNNVGISVAKGRYVCLVNTDVVLIKGCMSKLLHHIEQHTEIGLIAPQILNGDGSLQISVRKEVTLFNTFCRIFFIDYLFPGLIHFTHKTTENVEDVTGCFWLIRRDALEQVGLLDDCFYFYGEDRDYCKRMRMAKWKIVYLTEAQIYHYSGSSSKGRPNRYYCMMDKAALIFWKKHHGLFSLFVYKALKIAYNFSRCLTNGIAWHVSRKKNEDYRIKSVRSWYSVLLYAGLLKFIKNEELSGL